jgi:DNA-binding LacI/PurR family transcriptional regulator
MFSPALTTIDQHAPEIGRAGAQMLFEILDGKTPESLKIATDLVVRQSSAAPVTVGPAA